MHLNVTGGFASALDWPDQTLVFGYPGLLAGSIADSISGGSIGPTAKSGLNQTPLFGFRSLQRFPVSSASFLKAASFQFIPLRCSNHPCGFERRQRSEVLHSLRASCRSARFRHAPSAFLSTAFRYASRGEDPGRSLELHRRFLESIGDQLDTVPGILFLQIPSQF